MTHKAPLFSALLKYWRTKRGLSQLDLAVAADISSRHLSFLETGRAKPSREMTLLLGVTLEVPLRQQNAMLRAAGFTDVYPESSELEPAVEDAIRRMLVQQEPYPMVVMNRTYEIVKTNQAAMRMLTQFIADPSVLQPPINALEMVLSPQAMRPFVIDWEMVARTLLSRLCREALHRAEDEGLRGLIERLFALPGVNAAWRQPDFSTLSPATLQLRLRRDEHELGFLTTITTFSAPQNVTLDELQFESYFPLDEATRQAALAAAS